MIHFEVYKNGRSIGMASGTLEDAFWWVDSGYQVIIAERVAS